MATNYPGSLDTGTEQPSPLASTEMDDAGFEHDVVHTNHSGAIIALETKVGTGSSTAVADSVLAGTGSGTSAWSTSPTLAGLTVDTDTLHVDTANGRVGIGTTSPDSTLHVAGTIDADGNLNLKQSNNSASVNWHDTLDGTFWHMSGPRTSNNNLNVYWNDGTSYHMVAAFDENKRLGINTESPAYTLDVNGTSRITGDLNVIGNSQVQILTSDATYPKIGNYYSSSDNLEIGSFGGIDFAIDTSNNTSEVFNWRSGGSAGAGSLLMQLNEAAELSIGGNGSVAGAHLHVHSRNRAVSVMDSSWDNYAELGYTTQGSTNPSYGLLTGYALFFKTGTSRAGLADRMYISADGRVAINGTSLQSGYELTVNGDTYQTGTCRAALHDTAGTSTRDKVRVWNNSSYSIGMGSGYQFGYIGGITGGSDYVMSFQMSNSNNRGWWWGDTGHTNSQGAMSLSTQGKLYVATRIHVGGGESRINPIDTYNFVNSGTSYLYGTISAPTTYNLTTSSTAQLVHISSSTYDNKLYRSTSVRASKKNIEDIEDRYADLMLQSRPVWYESALDNDDPGWSWLGLIAEEQAELDSRFATWQVKEDWEGEHFDHLSMYPTEALEVTGVPYERLAVPLLVLCKRQQTEIDALEDRIAALEAEA